MSRTALTAASLFIVVGCVVVMVRAQDSGPSEPGAFPTEAGSAAIADQEPTPATRRDSAFVPPAGEPTPAIRPSTVSDQGAAGNARRPTAAERLQQVREATNRGISGRSSGRTAVSGPVTADPTTLRGGRLAEQPGDRDLITPTSPTPAEPTEAPSAGGTSILKGSDGAASDRPTARRQTKSAPSVRTRSPSLTPKPIPAPQAATTMPTAAPLNTPATTPAALSAQGIIRTQGPQLRVETSGPKAVRIGTESTYTITVSNDSDIEANDVFIRVGLPSSAKVVAEGAAEVGVASEDPKEQRCVWSIAKLAGRGTENLTFKVTPTVNASLDLFVDWTVRPISAVAQIEVQQPQLEMSVFGPKDIAYGEAAKYTIRLTNPGNGDADGVTVEFAYGDHRLDPKTVGTLAAGQSQEISLELTARQAGALPVVAIATASGNLRAEASQEVLVRRASLEATVAGDAAVFAGAPAKYQVTVRNAGNAPANQVAATVTLPEGAQLIRVGEEAQGSPSGIQWNLGILPPNGERTLEIECLLTTSGENPLQVRVTGANDLEASSAFVTRVEALADLKLVVNDPQGPVAVGQDALYEIHIANRGTKAATKINVVAQFSPGIEPQEATGAPAELVPGQVIFQAVPRIDPGQEVTLIVRAKADGQGTKRFRAEVTCEELETQLVAQETTYFYADSAKTGQSRPAATKR